MRERLQPLRAVVHEQLLIAVVLMMDQMARMLLLVVAACSASSHPAEPISSGKPIDPYAGDLHTACGADAAAHARTFDELHAYLDEHATSPRMTSALADLPKVDKQALLELLAKLQADARAAGIATCPPIEHLRAGPACGDVPCAPPAACLTAVHMGGGESQDCEIPCGAKACPAGMHCTMVYDGVGQVCRPGPGDQD